MITWPSTVPTVTDSVSQVSEDVINPIIQSLVDRTQYLFDQVEATNDRSALVLLSQPVVEGIMLSAYDVVFYDTTTDNPGFNRAKAALSSATTAPFLRAANSSFVFGIVKSVSEDGLTADIYLQGIVNNGGIDNSFLSRILDTDSASFTSGPLYLSASEGKLTANPPSFALYVGYAKSLNELYLNPSYDSVNSLFSSFKYSLLPRPAGTPAQVLSGSDRLWQINSYSLSKIGWIPASASGKTLPTFGVDTPAYFYNVPDAGAGTLLTNNPELTTLDLRDAGDIRRALPYNARALTSLTVNGVALKQKEEEGDGCIFYINNDGIWWFTAPADGYDNNQPWAAGLFNSIIPLTATTTTDSDILFADHTFEVNDEVTFILDGSGATAVLPSGGNTHSKILLNTKYYVRSVDLSAHTITLEDESGTHLDTLPDTTFAGVCIAWIPKFWSFSKGSDMERPLITLQLTTVNPDVKQNLVTSLTATGTSATPTLQFVNKDGVKSYAGDLQAQFNFNPVILPATAAVLKVSEGTSVKLLYYDQVVDTWYVYTDTTVREIRNGGGINVVTDALGNATLSLSGLSQSVIETLEPEGGRYVYYGLHSFLTLDNNSLPAGFVGKFTLPDSLVTTTGQYLYVNVMCFGTTPGNATAKKVQFKFEYAVSTLGNVLSTNITAGGTDYLSFDTTKYPAAYKYLELGPNNTSNTFNNGTYLFRIPVSELKSKSTVNFRITRTKGTTSDYYIGSIGIVGVSWVML